MLHWTFCLIINHTQNWMPVVNISETVLLKTLFNASLCLNLIIYLKVKIRNTNKTEIFKFVLKTIINIYFVRSY